MKRRNAPLRHGDDVRRRRHGRGRNLRDGCRLMARRPADDCTAILRGGEWLLAAVRRRQPSSRPSGCTDEHRLIAQTAAGVRRQRSAAGARPARAEGLGAGARSCCSAAASSACSASTCPRRTAASASTRSRRSSSASGWRASASFGADVRRAGQPDDPAARAVRHRGQKQKYLPRLLTGEMIGAYA